MLRVHDADRVDPLSSLATLREVVDELALTHGVPGASVAVWDDGRLELAAVGLARSDTGWPATATTLFQIGSITKLHTTALVLQLLEDGLIALDDPVARHVPEVAGAPWAERVTLRHLLAHTSGLDGDLHLVDTGDDDGALASYCASTTSLGVLFEPGAHVSYCNAGFSVLGRLVECLRGAPFEAVHRERLLAPLGLAATVTTAGEAAARPLAIGHYPSRREPGVRPSPTWDHLRGLLPAGAGSAATAADVASFAVALTWGATIVGSDSAAAALEPQVPTSAGTVPRGLGWELVPWSGARVASHDGANAGFCAALRVLPDDGLVVVSLTNWARGPRMNDAVVAAVVGECRGCAPPPAAASADVPLSPSVAGTYVRLGVEQRVTLGPTGATLTVASGGRSTEHVLVATGSTSARYDDPIFGTVAVELLPEHLVAQGRAARRA